MGCGCGSSSLTETLQQIGGFRYSTPKKARKSRRKGGKSAKKTATRGGGKKH